MPLRKPKRQWLYAGCLLFLVLALAAAIVVARLRGPVTMLPPEAATRLLTNSAETPAPQPASPSSPQHPPPPALTAPTLAAASLSIAYLNALIETRPAPLEVDPMEQLGRHRNYVYVGGDAEKQRRSSHYRAEALSIATLLAVARPDDDPETLAYLERTAPLVEKVRAYIRATPAGVLSWKLFPDEDALKKIGEESPVYPQVFIRNLLVANALHASRVLGDDARALGLLADAALLQTNMAAHQIFTDREAGLLWRSQYLAPELAASTESEETLRRILKRLDELPPLRPSSEQSEQAVAEIYRDIEEALREKKRAQAEEVSQMSLDRRLGEAYWRYKEARKLAGHVNALHDGFKDVVSIMDAADYYEAWDDAPPGLHEAAKHLGVLEKLGERVGRTWAVEGAVTELRHVLRRELHKREHGRYPRRGRAQGIGPELCPLGQGQGYSVRHEPSGKGRGASQREWERRNEIIGAIVPDDDAIMGAWTLLGPYDEANEPHPQSLLKAHELGLTPTELAKEAEALRTPLDKDAELGAVRFGDPFTLPRARIYYALAYLRAQRGTKAWAGITANSTASLWIGPFDFKEVEGDHMYSKWPLSAGEGLAMATPVNLRTGVTPVLVRIRNRYGTAAFQCAIHDEEGKLPEGVTFIREP